MLIHPSNYIMPNFKRRGNIGGAVWLAFCGGSILALQKGSSERDEYQGEEHCGGNSEEEEGVERARKRERVLRSFRIFPIWKSFEIIVSYCFLQGKQ